MKYQQWGIIIKLLTMWKEECDEKNKISKGIVNLFEQSYNKYGENDSVILQEKDTKERHKSNRI